MYPIRGLRVHELQKEYAPDLVHIEGVYLFISNDMKASKDPTLSYKWYWKFVNKLGKKFEVQ